jgi:hypothetical protein
MKILHPHFIPCYKADDEQLLRPLQEKGRPTNAIIALWHSWKKAMIRSFINYGVCMKSINHVRA